RPDAGVRVMRPVVIARPVPAVIWVRPPPVPGMPVMMSVMRAVPAVTVPPAARLGRRRHQQECQHGRGEYTKELFHGFLSQSTHSDNAVRDGPLRRCLASN